MAEKTGEQILRVTIRSRKNFLYEGLAKSVTSNNNSGIFDILPQHANFITTIKDFIKVIDPAGEVKDFEVNNGVLRYYKGDVDAYLTVS